MLQGQKNSLTGSKLDEIDYVERYLLNLTLRQYKKIHIVLNTTGI